MSSFWNFAFGFILVIVWVIAGGFVTQASVFLTSYRDTDDNLHRAYWFTFWASFVTWFLIAIFIILIILSVLGVAALFGSGAGELGVAAEGEAAAAEGGLGVTEGFVPNMQSVKSSQGISWTTIVFLIFALILVIVTGTLSAIASSNIKQSSNYKNTISKLETAYNDCIIAAVMCLGAAGILIIGLFVYFIIGYQQSQKIRAQEEKIQAQKRLELSEIKQLQARSVQLQLEKQEAFKLQLQQAVLQRIQQPQDLTLSKQLSTQDLTLSKQPPTQDLTLSKQPPTQDLTLSKQLSTQDLTPKQPPTQDLTSKQPPKQTISPSTKQTISPSTKQTISPSTKKISIPSTPKR
jgi:heme/copper-type cytochrome/quinol oxidase subunit 2